MGQYWRIYNLDKRELISFSGSKLGEWYFADDPPRILIILRRNREENWCEDRIICIGDYTDVNDLPEGLVTDDELMELGYRRELRRVRVRKAAEVVEEEKLLWVPRDMYYHLAEQYRTVRDLESYAGDYGPYVLRNMSKKVYIRGDGAKAPDGSTLLGYCLFARICWSRDPSSSMSQTSYAPEITRGLWAGDRLDVVLLEDVKDALENERWKDATKQISRQVESIFEVNGVPL
ncbi:hypothetical protein BDQ17DRAFT_1429072 [Cyathus striatus]|nr:hypothetical protein BDQ17DRAFT_1429072 [Cyathus striatus]